MNESEIKALVGEAICSGLDAAADVAHKLAESTSASMLPTSVVLTMLADTLNGRATDLRGQIKDGTLFGGEA